VPRSACLVAALIIAAVPATVPSAGSEWDEAWIRILDEAESAGDSGDIILAERLFREAAALASDHASGTIRDVRSRDALAFFLLRSGRYEEAEILYSALVPEWQRLLGPDQPRLATCLNNLGVARFHLGRADDALAPLRQAVEIWTRSLGPAHPDTVRAARSLALAERRAGPRSEPAPTRADNAD